MGGIDAYGMQQETGERTRFAKTETRQSIVAAPKKKTLSGVAYEYIKELISSGTLADGDILTGTQLGVHLNMSRTPIKQALTQLEAEGYIKCIDGVGHIVEGMTLAKLRNLYEVRAAMEALAIKRAIPHISRHDLADVKACWLKELALYRDAPQDYALDRITVLDERFHGLFISKSGNEYAIKILDSIQVQINRYRNKAYVITNTTEESMAQHIAIIDALLSGKTEEAQELMKEHLQWSFEVLANAMFDSIV